MSLENQIRMAFILLKDNKWAVLGGIAGWGLFSFASIRFLSEYGQVSQDVTTIVGFLAGVFFGSLVDSSLKISKQGKVD